MPNDGGNLLLNEDEKNSLINDESGSVGYIKPFISAKEYLNGINRYCLWLSDITPSILNCLPKVLERVTAVKEKRLESTINATKELANTPYLFGEIRQPDSDYIVIPAITSENRDYIPLSFFNKDYIVGNSCFAVSDATLYHFGILMSEIHMTWVKYVCGRLKGDYRYSINIVYNNFPWPQPNETQIKNIKKASKKLLAIRNEMLKDSSLADLYNPLTMPNDLRNAHKKLDKAVYKAYGKTFKNEMEIVNFLFELYEKYQEEGVVKWLPLELLVM